MSRAIKERPRHILERNITKADIRVGDLWMWKSNNITMYNMKLILQKCDDDCCICYVVMNYDDNKDTSVFMRLTYDNYSIAISEGCELLSRVTHG